MFKNVKKNTTIMEMAKTEFDLKFEKATNPYKKNDAIIKKNLFQL